MFQIACLTQSWRWPCLDRCHARRSTTRHHAHDVKLFSRRCQKPLAEVTPQDADGYADNELARCLNKATTHRRLASLRRLPYFWQERQGDDPAWHNLVRPRRHQAGVVSGIQPNSSVRVAERLPCCYLFNRSASGMQVAELAP